MERSDARDAIGSARERGRRSATAIEHNVRVFWQAVEDRGIGRQAVRERADRLEPTLDDARRAELNAASAAADVPYRDGCAYALFEPAVIPRGCSVAVAVGDASKREETIFFKQSDKRGSEAFEGEGYYRHQQINVLRVERPKHGNAVLGITPAGSSALKMGLNEKGVAIGSNFGHTTTHDESVDDPESWAAASRGEYMRQGLIQGDTAVEVAQVIAAKLLETPMSSPGSITIADANRAIVLEGEFTHLASEWIDDGVIIRTNKFELLDDLVPSQDEIASSHRRSERLREVLEATRGEITVETMRELSVDHTNGPGAESVCRHREADYTDATSLSAAVFAIGDDGPAESDAYVALGTPCQAWESDEGDGWLHLSPDVTPEEVPDRFQSGQAWLDHYLEEPSAEKAPTGGAAE